MPALPRALAHALVYAQSSFSSALMRPILTPPRLDLVPFPPLLDLVCVLGRVLVTVSPVPTTTRLVRLFVRCSDYPVILVRVLFSISRCLMRFHLMFELLLPYCFPVICNVFTSSVC
jgi:hypothetical protein